MLKINNNESMKKKKYDESIFNFINKIELNKYSDIIIDTLLNKCEQECLLIGIESINSTNFNLLAINCLKVINIENNKVSSTFPTGPLIRNLVYSYIIMRIHDFNCTINHLEIIDRNKLLEDYPEFVDLSEEEITYLLKFRNIVKIIINMFENKTIKQICIDIGGILEGSGKKYICGSGETTQTKRRVLIFRKEANVNLEKRNGYNKRSRSVSLCDTNIKVSFKKNKKSKNIFKNNMKEYMSSIDQNINTILYDENIEEKLLKSFNSDLFNDLNT